MKHNMIESWMHISMGLGFVFLILVFVVWFLKIYKPLVAKLTLMKTRSSRTVGIYTLIYLFPAVLVGVLGFVPCFYFANLYKKFDYCIELAQVNHLRDTSDTELNIRCKGMDLQEIIDESQIVF